MFFILWVQTHCAVHIGYVDVLIFNYLYQPLAIAKDRKFMILINLDSVNIVAKYLERRGQGMEEKVCLSV